MFIDSRLVVFSNRDERIQWNLTPLNEALFAIENADYNVRCDVDDSSNTISLVFLHWSQDKENPIKKTES